VNAALDHENGFAFVPCAGRGRLYSAAMKKRLVSASAWAWFALACLTLRVAGQSVSVEVAFDREQYLVGEELVARVRITNFSGQTLTMGQEEDWLTFSIEGGPSRIVSRRAPVPVVGEFKLNSSTIGTRRVDLAPYFDLTRPGRYKISATVRIPSLKATVQSPVKAINLVAGTLLWERDFGFPQPSQAAGPTDGLPETRKYALLQATFEKDLIMFARVTDARTGRTLQVQQIGPLVSFSNPEGQIDRFSNLHVLYQVGARSFLYTMLTPDGVMLTRETHEISTSKPVLRPSADGRIKVTGGVRRPMANDLPPASVSAVAPGGSVSQ
jgi:hypothetical protein